LLRLLTSDFWLPAVIVIYLLGWSLSPKPAISTPEHLQQRNASKPFPERRSRDQNDQQRARVLWFRRRIATYEARRVDQQFASVPLGRPDPGCDSKSYISKLKEIIEANRGMSRLAPRGSPGLGWFPMLKPSPSRIGHLHPRHLFG
jgi:hypothetical protein